MESNQIDTISDTCCSTLAACLTRQHTPDQRKTGRSPKNLVGEGVHGLTCGSFTWKTRPSASTVRILLAATKCLRAVVFVDFARLALLKRVDNRRLAALALNHDELTSRLKINSGKEDKTYHLLVESSVLLYLHKPGAQKRQKVARMTMKLSELHDRQWRISDEEEDDRVRANYGLYTHTQKMSARAMRTLR